MVFPAFYQNHPKTEMWVRIRSRQKLWIFLFFNLSQSESKNDLYVFQCSILHSAVVMNGSSGKTPSSCIGLDFVEKVVVVSCFDGFSETTGKEWTDFGTKSESELQNVWCFAEGTMVKALKQTLRWMF